MTLLNVNKKAELSQRWPPDAPYTSALATATFPAASNGAAASNKSVINS